MASSSLRAPFRKPDITRNRKIYEGKIAWGIKWNELGGGRISKKFHFSQNQISSRGSIFLTKFFREIAAGKYSLLNAAGNCIFKKRLGVPLDNYLKIYPTSNVFLRKRRTIQFNPDRDEKEFWPKPPPRPNPSFQKKKSFSFAVVSLTLNASCAQFSHKTTAQPNLDLNAT